MKEDKAQNKCTVEEEEGRCTANWEELEENGCTAIRGKEEDKSGASWTRRIEEEREKCRL